MIRAEPCSPLPLWTSRLRMGPIPLIMVALLWTRPAGRHGDRLRRADAEGAGTGQANGVREVVLERDRLPRHRGVPDVERPVGCARGNLRRQERRRADRRADLVGTGAAETRPGRKLDL